MNNENLKFDDDLKKNNVMLIGQSEIQKIKPFIGEGKFGKVYKGIYNNTTVAIKKMVFEEKIDSSENRDEIISEIKNLGAAVCENVPKFYGIWRGLNGKNYHLIFEFIIGEPLSNLVKSLTYDEKIYIIYQIAEIVNFLHLKKLFHRDIKPDNIMVNIESKKIKLIDFGTAKLATKTVTFTARAVGTTIYMAPDFFDVDENNDDDKPISNSPKVDVWSIGCMISELLSGITPWHNLTKIENKVEAYLIKKTPFPIPKEIKEKYPEFHELIQNCTKINPNDRCTTDDIIKFLAPLIKLK